MNQNLATLGSGVQFVNDAVNQNLTSIESDLSDIQTDVSNLQ
jgi:hypothetical protein